MNDKPPGYVFGCPTKYRAEFCQQVIELGKQGYSRTEIANALDVVKNPLTNWENEHPDFLSAMTRAREASQSWWETQGRKYLINEPQGPTMNAALYGKQMACRFPDDWRENTKVEHTGKDGGALVIERVIVDPGKKDDL